VDDETGQQSSDFFRANAKNHEQRMGLEGALPVVMMRAAELQWVLTEACVPMTRRKSPICRIHGAYSNRLGKGEGQK
jgi:hypothetical protein